MRINVDEITETEMDIREFGSANGLVLFTVTRDRPVGDPARYYVQFRDSGIMVNGCLQTESGNGPTIEAAIADYARKISHERLAIGTLTAGRREIAVPRLTYKCPAEERERQWRRFVVEALELLDGMHREMGLKQVEIERLRADLKELALAWPNNSPSSTLEPASAKLLSNP